MEIRRKLIESGAVDVMIAIGSNFFLNVTLPCTLWFLDKGKKGRRGRTRCSSSMRGRSSGS
jgi:type I restriction enzyme M protein